MYATVLINFYERSVSRCMMGMMVNVLGLSFAQKIEGNGLLRDIRTTCGAKRGRGRLLQFEREAVRPFGQFPIGNSSN